LNRGEAKKEGEEKGGETNEPKRRPKCQLGKGKKGCRSFSHCGLNRTKKPKKKKRLPREKRELIEKIVGLGGAGRKKEIGVVRTGEYELQTRGKSQAGKLGKTGRGDGTCP